VSCAICNPSQTTGPVTVKYIIVTANGIARLPENKILLAKAFRKLTVWKD
jgi:hypothetical protein